MGSPQFCGAGCKVGKAQRIGNYFFAACLPRRIGRSTDRLCALARKKKKKNSSQSREGAKASGSHTEQTIISLRPVCRQAGSTSLRELNNPPPCAAAYGTGIPPCKSLSRCISGGSCPNASL